MTRSSRSRVLVILLVLLFAGTAVAFFSGKLALPTWTDVVAHNAGHETDGLQNQQAAAPERKQLKSETTPAAAADRDSDKPSSPQDPASNQTSPTGASNRDFDVATIDPDGVSVFAGSTAAPNSRVTVLADGVAVGSTNADADGAWTLVLEKRLASRTPRLSITVGKSDPVANEPTKAAGTQTPATAPVSVAASPEKGAGAAAAAPSPDPGNSRRKLAKATDLPSVRDIQAGFMRNLEHLVETARATGGEKRVAALVSAAASQSRSTETQPDENYARGPNPDPLPPKPVPLAKVGEQIAVLIPVAFIYREPNLTPEGRRAAELLLEYVKLKQFKSLTLTGHADERGSDAFNMELSRSRLQTVAEILRRGGYRGELNLVAKGKSEPFQGVDRARFDQEDLYQLDRRVELLASR